MPKLRRGVSVASTEYGMALLDADRGQYWTLNPTGVLVLEALLAGESNAQAAQRVADEYDVDVETARRDADELEALLRSAELVTW